MTNSRRTKKNINKEIMFNKIMPSYLTNTYTEYYSNSNQNSEYRNPKSEPDTFKIREKVLSAMEPRPLVPEEDDDTDDAEIAELYERSGSRGLPEHIFEISKWFLQLSQTAIIKNEREMFRSVLKKYNAELGFRNYFSLSKEDKYFIFKNCFQTELSNLS